MLAAIGIVLPLLFFAVPALRRPLFVTWMALAFPIGWTAHHVLLGGVYYLVLSPIAIVMRLAGRDTLERRWDSGRASYWVARPRCHDVESYFRQF